MPSHEHLDPLINLVNQATLTPAKLDSLYRITRYRQQLNDIAERANRARLASVEFVMRHYYVYLTGRYERERVNFDGLPSNPPSNSAIHVTPKVKPRSGAGGLRRHRRQLARLILADAATPRIAGRAVLPRAATEPVLHDARLQRR